MLFAIQEGRHCMPTTDYYFTNIQPDSIIVSPHRRNHSELTVQHATTKDQVSQQIHPVQPVKTRVHPSMLADKEVPVLNLHYYFPSRPSHSVSVLTFVLYERR